MFSNIGSGLRGRTTGPVVGYSTPQQLSHWAACLRDPWVVVTLARGYELQFHRRSPSSGWVVTMVIKDSAKAQALGLFTIMDKDVIIEVDPILQPRGLYSTYFTKKDDGFQPILDLHSLNTYLKVLPFYMLTTAGVMSVRGPARRWFSLINPQGLLFPCANRGSSPTLPTVCLSGPPSSLQGAPLMSFPVSQGFYLMCGSSSGASPSRRCEGAPIHQRWACVFTLPVPGGPGYLPPPDAHSKAWLPG